MPNEEPASSLSRTSLASAAEGFAAPHLSQVVALSKFLSHHHKRGSQLKESIKRVGCVSIPLLLKENQKVLKRTKGHNHAGDPVPRFETPPYGHLLIFQRTAKLRPGHAAAVEA